MTGFIIILILILAFIVATSFRVVPQGEVFIKERLGREAGELQPGIHFIIPFIDRTIRQSKEADSSSFQFGKVTTTISFKVIDAVLLRRSVPDLQSAIRIGAETRLKKHLGDDLSSVSIIDCSRIESEFFRDMVDLFEPWGVAINKVALAIKP